MNYLAHAFLSRKDADLQLGNFIADHIRGNQLQHFPLAIQEGIRMHRAIDTFTDQHHLFRASKRLFYDGFEKYSGVLVDIYFDYFLASNFENYSEKTLQDFSDATYHVYQSAEKDLPESSKRFLKYVVTNNVFVSYGSVDGISTVLGHLSHRINHPIELQQSVKLFDVNKVELQDNFSAFFAELNAEFT